MNTPFSKRSLAVFSVLAVLCTGCDFKAAPPRRISKLDAVRIALEQEETKAFSHLHGGLLRTCIASYAKEACNSEYVTCVDDAAWVVRFYLKPDCSYYPDERVGVHFLISSTGQIISRFPEMEYLEDPLFCRADDDCMCSAADGACSRCENYFYAHIAEDYEELKDLGLYCSCRDTRCVSVHD